MIWPWLLFGCAITAIGLHEKIAPGSPKLALIFAIHIIAMQGIKYLDLPQYAILFFACYSIMALAAALWFDKIAAFTLAAIAIVYLVFAFGFISRHTGGIIADVGFIAAMVIGMINGPSEGLLVRNDAVRSTGYMGNVEVPELHPNSNQKSMAKDP